MNKIVRLNTLVQSGAFITCKCCGYTYVPMTKRAETNCPKCKPLDHQMKYVDPDIAYLHEEVRLEEEVSQEYLFDGNVTYRQLGL